MTDKLTGTKVKGGVVRVHVEPGIGATLELANCRGETIIFVSMSPAELRQRAIAVAEAVSQLHSVTEKP
jgi:hypothetical protein